MQYIFSIFSNKQARSHSLRTYATIDDFLNGEKSDQNHKDDLSGFVAGKLNAGRRVKENVVSRSVLTYDIDDYDGSLSDLEHIVKQRLEPYIYAYYTTCSHGIGGKTKIRLLIPLNCDVEADTFEALSKYIFEQLFKNEITCDPASHRVAQLMFVPHRDSRIFLSQNMCAVEAKVFEVTDELLYDIVNQEVNVASSEHDNSTTMLSDEQIHEILTAYKADDLEYKDWIVVVMAISHQFLGLKRGLKVVKWWSANNTRLLKKYPDQQKRDKEIEAQYERIKNTKEKNITMRSILHFIRSKDLDAFEKIKGIADIKEAATSKHGLHYDNDRIDVLEFPDLVYTSKNKLVVEPSAKNFLFMCKRFNVFRKFDIIKNEYKFFISNKEMKDESVFKANIYSLCVKHKMEKSFVQLYAMIKELDVEYHPFLEVIKNWDGKSRLQEFYSTLKVEKKYEQLRDMYLEVFLKQIVYISCEKNYLESPRYVLALGGDQGIGKSTWVRSLLPQSFSAYIRAGAIIDLSRSFEVSEILSHIICEIGEFAATMKKNDVNRLKAFLTNNADSIDRKFRDPVKRKRSTSFICTFNDDKIFNDETGNSRFLTLPVLQCNFSHDIDMLQVFAEVKSRFDCSQFKLDQAIIAKQEELNNKYQVSSDIEDIFYRYFELGDKSGIYDKEQYDVVLYNSVEILEVMGYDKKASNFDLLAKKIKKFFSKNKIKPVGDEKYLLLQRRYVEDASSIKNQAVKAGEEKIKELNIAALKAGNEKIKELNSKVVQFDPAFNEKMK